MTRNSTKASSTPPNRSGQNRWGRIPAWWLDHPDLDADGLAVLAALSTYADEAGVCWPSQATLAEKLKRSRPTVNRILGRLEALELVGIEHRRSANGGRLSCRYRLVLLAGNAATDGAGVDSPVDSPADSPCSAASHEQPEPEQIPDTLHRRADEHETTPAEPVPQDWVPAPTDRQWATAQFPEVDVGRHAERFVQQCRAHGYRYRDPAAAWRSWLLQDMARVTARMEQRPAATVRAPDGRAGRAGSRPVMPTAAAGAEQRLSAWASVAARLNGGQPVGQSATGHSAAALSTSSTTAASPWGIA
ncbi:helix-turn-helix domain-containing protein [Azospirillum sp. YIM B02556]|uniref:Helix-turn-helix domain-containing protein n=1 Tax=Azospirillum endophyticum TaxID=2800326 RepID=A0ABS1FHC5_9PROT|nr:helix-turn-helix domain-containing protein [Azospirillum endophyticum]MBK1842597.1 helix-turn-helix domain-containing protein [Azospirillum endophyticum]